MPPHNFCHPAHGAPRAIEDLVREVSAAIRLVCETPWSAAWGFGAAHELEEAGAHELHHDFSTLRESILGFEPA